MPSAPTGNYLDQGYTSANAISWTFNQPVRAFGFYDVGSDDGDNVTVYSTSLAILGTFSTLEVSGTPLFWGFIVNQDIGRVDIVPRVGNGYIGIDGLSVVAIPEPFTVSLLLGATALLGVWLGRRIS